MEVILNVFFSIVYIKIFLQSLINIKRLTCFYDIAGCVRFNHACTENNGENRVQTHNIVIFANEYTHLFAEGVQAVYLLKGQRP